MSFISIFTSALDVLYLYLYFGSRVRKRRNGSTLHKEFCVHSLRLRVLLNVFLYFLCFFLTPSAFRSK